MKFNALIIFINILILVTIFVIYKKNKYQYGLVPVSSSIDNKKYLVRNKKDRQKAADLLAKLKNTVKILISKLMQEYPNNVPINRLNDKFKPNRIHETPNNTQFTSYSVNKGKHLYLCIRDKKTHDFEDVNILLYVLTHELAHVMSESIGHTKEFWDNFKFLLKKSVEYKIYKYVDYNSYPTKYCGLNINNNILNNK
tara:strand:- start:1625 stop:2215 length:591 start_codon:yes stop_codon:yes gene_type:complete